MTPRTKLVFVQLNEINFDVVSRYLDDTHLPAFRELMTRYDRVETFAECEYTHLEPWIQWVSAQTGKTFGEHGVYRLGDITHSELPQIFEMLEARGLRVGAVSPMNACNRLKRPAYFIPDPWTQTPPDSSGYSRRLAQMLRQTVNENAQGRISKRSLITLGEAIARTLHPSRTMRLLRLIARSSGRPWLKALVLDQLLHMVHMRLLEDSQPDVSFVFFNAGAHIQHHYFLNSKHSGVTARNPPWYVAVDADPIRDMLVEYDAMLADVLALRERGARLIVATGLTQVPYDRVKYYYRLKDHAAFLRSLGLRFANVLPRMTRDFEVVFGERADAEACLALLPAIRMQRDGTALFGDVEDRGLSLFATLTYPYEISPSDAAVHPAGRIDDFGHQVAFVAIKNGMHSGKGFAFVSPGAPAPLPKEPVHVAELFGMTLSAAS